MLFALAVSQVAIYAADLVGIGAPLNDKWPACAHLGVGLVLIAASWLGWRQSQSPGMKDKVTFVCSLPFLGLLLDVLLVVLYFIVIRTVEIEQKAGATTLAVPSAIPESLWVLIVFAVYAVWDLIADVFSKDCIPKAPFRYRAFKYIRVAIVSVITSVVCLLLSYQSYCIATTATDSTEILFLDGMLVAVILLFRILKACENPLAKCFRVIDCKAFLTPRKTEGTELFWGTVLMLLYALCAAGAFGFDLRRIIASMPF